MKRIFPFLFLLGLGVVIALQNVSLGSSFMGWDNLLPELDFAGNIHRTLSAVWQEHQGLGLLGGNGHAAEIVHQVILWLLSLILPLWSLRQVFLLSSLTAGGIGAFMLIRELLRSEKQEKLNSWDFVALIGSCFYLLNLATIQNFYIAFEPFVTQFTLLPWLFYASLLYLRKATHKHFLLLLILNILAIPQGQVPTVFLVYFASLLFMLLIVNLGRKTYLKQTTLILILTIACNALWLLPFTYFTLTGSSVAFTAKINQMSTDVVFLQNKELGRLPDVALLKGFWLNVIDVSKQGTYDYLMKDWREWLHNPLVYGLGILQFVVISIGILSSALAQFRLCKHPQRIARDNQATKSFVQQRFSLAFTLLFCLCVTLLLTDTPVFAQINSFLREHIPFFKQIFRFPFTKFSTLTSLLYAIFFALGASTLIDRLDKTNISLLKKWGGYGVIGILFLTLCTFSYPVFNGHLFYEKNKISLPAEYTELFAFFSTQDPNTRIANFPQHTFWGWSYYRWGYGGSGFLWYGIRQPILDRAFDVWSETSENYYHEISQALYAKNKEQFLATLQKYQVSWLVIDENIINPSSPDSLFTKELEEILSSNSEIIPVKKFGKIRIYQVLLKDKPTSFVTIKEHLPTANGFSWGNQDQAYEELGDYLTKQNANVVNNLFPFRTLFANKARNQQEYAVSEGTNTFSIKTDVSLSSHTDLVIPSFAKTQKLIPVEITMSKNVEGLSVSYKTVPPRISLGGQRVFGEEKRQELFQIPKDTNTASLVIDINGITKIKLNTLTDPYTTFFSLSEDTIIVLSDGKKTLGTTVVNHSDLLTTELTQEKRIPLQRADKENLLITYPKVTDPYFSLQAFPSQKAASGQCDIFREGTSDVQLQTGFITLRSQNTTSCMIFYSSTLPHDEGYISFVKSSYQKGLPWHFWILNESTKHAPIDTMLEKNRQEETTTFILPPQDPYGRGYSFHFDNVSIGSELTSNAMRNVSTYAFPYTFISDISIQSGQNRIQSSNLSLVIDVNHPRESLFVITIPTFKAKAKPTLFLSQSFNEGWNGYVMSSCDTRTLSCQLTHYFPFLFGEKIEEHVQVNNWANGWILPQAESTKKDIVLIYLPQYFQDLGMATLVLTLLYSFGTVAIRRIHKRKSDSYA